MIDVHTVTDVVQVRSAYILQQVRAEVAVVLPLKRVYTTSIIVELNEPTAEREEPKKRRIKKIRGAVGPAQAH